MKRTTKSGCKVTYAPFWLSKRYCQGEPYWLVTVNRPKTGNPEPLTANEAFRWFHTGIEWTDDATDLLAMIRGWRK